MRKALSQNLKTEQLGELKSLGGDIDVNAELKVCTGKLIEIEKLAESIRDVTQVHEYETFATKVSHILGRIARIKAESQEVSESVDLLRKSIQTLEASVLQKVDTDFVEQP
ncbi:hypothetical protein CBL_21422, partial [Carabus blaptoides fortunei]